MAICAPASSAGVVNNTATPPVLNEGLDGRLLIKHDTLTLTAAGYTTANAADLTLMRMPAGKVRIYGHLSRLILPAATATSDFDLGFGAYTNQAGTAVAANGVAMDASIDVGGGAIDQDLDTVADVYEIESKSGFDIVGSYDTENSAASGVMRLIIAYTHEG